MKEFKNESYVRSTETPYVKMFIEDGILYIHYKGMDKLDLEKATEIVNKRKEFTDYQTYPLFVDLISIKETTKEARDYLATEGNEGISANALLVNSAVLKMMVNFYIMVNKPLKPTRMFTDKQSALEWLEQFKS